MSPISVRIDPDLAFGPGLGSGFSRVPFERPGADVVVASGARPPPPIRGEAVVRVGDAGPEWLEVPIDLAVQPGELARDGDAVVVRARNRRLALRPSGSDAPADWLAAVRALLEADVVQIVGPEAVPAFGPVERAARAGVVAAAPAAALTARLGPVPGLDAVVARALGARPGDGVLVVGVAADGSSWLARTEPLARAVLEAAVLRAAEQRLRDAERKAAETAALMRQLMSVATHDLSNLLFAAHLGVAAVERQAGPAAAAQVQKLGRSITAAVTLVRRISDTGIEIVDGPAPDAGRAHLPDAFARICDQLAHDRPGRTIEGAVPDVEVTVSEVVVERLLTVVLSNAVLHSEGPVTVRGEVTDDVVTIEVRNLGRLPFSSLERLEPFEHRTQRTIGAGLWAARRLIEQIPAACLQVCQEADGVKAVLRLPIESNADIRS